MIANEATGFRFSLKDGHRFSYETYPEWLIKTSSSPSGGVQCSVSKPDVGGERPH